MVEALIIAFIIILSTVQNLLCKTYTVSYSGDSVDAAAIYALVTGGVTAVAAFALYGFSFGFSGLTLILGLVNAFLGAVLDLSLIKISRTGPYSVQMVFIINGGILIPAAVSACFGDEVSWMKWLAIAVMFPAVYLISCKKNETFTDRRTFFIYCVLAALGNGGFLSMLDVQQRLTGAEEKNAMVAVSYFGMAVISALWLICTHKGKPFAAFRMSKKALLYLILSGIVIAVAINAKVYMLPLVSTALLYTFDNAGTLLLSVVSSCILFKEKLSPKNTVGCCILIAALICVSLV